MFTRHRSKTSVKAYLLGALGDRECAVLEEKYFSDPLFFRWVRDSEDDLIRDYLGDRLPPPERERFERRYLVVPEMAKRVEALRSQTPPPVRYRLSWQIVVIALVLAVCAVTAWRLSRERIRMPAEAAQKHPAIVPAVLLPVRLLPGVRKSGNAAMTEFVAPPGGRVRLTMELPGLSSAVDCVAVLTLLPPDGPRRRIWTSDRLRSVPGPGGQEVRADLDSSALTPGDYIGQADSAAGGTLQTYEFRVNPK